MVQKRLILGNTFFVRTYIFSYVTPTKCNPILNQVGALGNPEFVFSEDGLGGVLFIKAVDIDGVKTFENLELELDFTTSTFTLKKFVDADTTIPEQPIDTVTKDGITFGVRGCVAESRTVTCHLLLTSNEFDRLITFCGNRDCCCYSQQSPAFDNFGNQYFPTTVAIANVEAKSNHLNHKLVADVTTEATIRFNNLSTRGTSFSLLYLGFGVNNESLKIQFRDISF
jgi:hypothetical protein